MPESQLLPADITFEPLLARPLYVGDRDTVARRRQHASPEIGNDRRRKDS
ncbi:hypothetical protein [Streptomyces roseochromogenus]|nr:hypothetical protein [Streptomyces roseochromogenus]